MHLVARDTNECSVNAVFGRSIHWWEDLLGKPRQAMMMSFDPALATWDVETPLSCEHLQIPKEDLILWVYPSRVLGSSLAISRQQGFAKLSVSLRRGMELSRDFNSLAYEFWSSATPDLRLAMFAGEELSVDLPVIRGYLAGDLEASSIDLCELAFHHLDNL